MTHCESENRPATRARKAKLFHRAASPQPIQLTRRDVEILQEVWRHRGLSGDQVRRLLLNCGPSMARRRLRALYDHGLLDRVAVATVPTQQLPPFLYVISPRGLKLLGELRAQFCPESSGEEDLVPRSSTLAETGLWFVRHRYLVNELHIVLQEAARRCGATIEWKHEEELTLPNGRGSRAEVVRHHDLPGPMTFLPDGYFVLRRSDGQSFAFFVELDLASHPHRVWHERAKLYLAYADPQAGLFRRRFGRQTFRLLIVTTPDYRRRSRRDNILRTIRASLGGPSDLFLAATLDDLHRDRILGACWKAPDDRGQWHALLPPAGPLVVQRRPPVIVVHGGNISRGTV